MDSPEGFGFEEKIDEVIDGLLRFKLITEQAVAERGREAVFAEETGGAVLTAETDLIPVTYVNRAGIRLASGEGRRAVETVGRALEFLPEDPWMRRVAMVVHAVEASRLAEDPEGFERLLESAASLTGSEDGFDRMLVSFGVAVAEHEGSRRRDFDRGGGVLDAIGRIRTLTPSARAELRESRRSFEVDWVDALMRRGEYAAAHARLGQLLGAWPGDPQVEEAYVLASLELARSLAAGSDFDGALRLVEDVFPRAEKVPRASEMYAYLVRYLKGSDTTLAKKLGRTRESLLAARAASAAPDRFGPVLAAVCERLAMIRLRKGDMPGTRELIREGLAFDGRNESLLQDARDLGLR